MHNKLIKAAGISLSFLFLLACGEPEPQAQSQAVLSLDADYTQPLAAAPVAIVPKPVSVSPLDGEFKLTAATQLHIAAGAEPVAQYLRELIGPATGYTLPLAQGDGAPSVIALVIDPAIEQDEAYELTVAPNKISLRAKNIVGLFWGVQTLRQLLPADIETNAPINRAYWPVAGVAIKDAPAFKYRGMHLDVSRTFFPVWFIKQYLDLMAMHKLNYFHWHLTDDQGWRIEIKQFPRLTEVGAWRSGTVVGHTYDKTYLNDNQQLGGFYTQAQIRDIVAYAQARNITIIPEIDVPGHASAILKAYPELACVEKDFDVQQHFGVFPEVLCPTEETFAFLEKVFTEVAELFPSPYLHVGGDEVKTEQWASCTYCNELMAREGLEDYFALQGYFIGRVEASINKLGRKIIGWDEILEGDVAPSATITSWRGVEGAIHAAKAGHDAIMAPGSHLYFDHYQSRSVDEPLAIHGLTPVQETYAFQVMPDELKGTEAANRILGAQGHLWTEYVRTPAKAEYMILPRMSALAEVVWTGDEGRSWNDFAKRLPAMIERFEQKGLNVAKTVYAVTSEVAHTQQGFQVILTSDMPNTKIRYTTDGSLPNHTSPVYKQPLLLKNGGVVRARALNTETGELYAERRLTLVDHLGLHASLEVLTEADRAWNTHPELSLVDGVLARDQIFQLDDWATFNGVDFEAIVSFDTAQTVQRLNLGFNPGRFRDFFGPTKLVVLASDDKSSWQPVASQDFTNDAKPQLGNSVTLEFAPVAAKYFKVIAENRAERFSTEKSKPVPATLYIDELIIQ
ncbi:family 20 glycosylhydrolase [Simiduia sp. 21SJ11W-1]|uniref:beta-N-acetylhexosaminidase n=1 Tax=Simiduia sp. 21SJ11W-1 TaxID=2909669 RepID=UPI0020A03496|nr:family 20 glycosylhydrolase [Simiduia sp. 21SJ11W-1]UTA46608.1 family 20 glycosylhydrolase [Simiduia sp. 21SJ11W-1]